MSKKRGRQADAAPEPANASGPPAAKPSFEEQLKHGREFLKRYEKTFKALAKS